MDIYIYIYLQSSSDQFLWEARIASVTQNPDYGKRDILTFWVAEAGYRILFWWALKVKQAQLPDYLGSSSRSGDGLDSFQDPFQVETLYCLSQFC